MFHDVDLAATGPVGGQAVVVGLRRVVALVDVSSHASPSIQKAGHEPVAVGSAMRASMRPYWKDFFVSVVMRHDVW